MSRLDKISLDKNLQAQLDKSGKSLTSLCRKLSLNKSAVHGYCNGTIPSGLPALIKLSEHFNKSIDELVFGQNSKELGHNNLETTTIEGRYEVTVKKLWPEE